MLRAGSLKHNVALQRRVDTQSDTGGSVTSWEPIASVWANVRYLSGLETSKAQFPVSVAKASIRIRFRDDVDATCRALYTSGGKTTYFEIKAVLPDLQSGEFVDLAVEAGATNG